MNAKIKEIVEELIAERIPRCEIIENPINVLEGQRLYDADFSKIRSYLKYEIEKGFFKITYPIFDEEEQFSKIRLNNDKKNKKGYRDLPGKGFFAKMRSTVNVRPYGVLEITHSGIHIARKETDFRYPGYQKIYSHTAYFIYKVELEKYIQLTTDDVNKALFLLKTKSIEELKNQFDAEIIDYLERLKKFKDQMVEIQYEYEQMRDRLYSLLALIDEKNKANIEDVQKVAKEIYEFALNDYETLVHCYFLHDKITDIEHSFHLKEADKLKIDTNQLLDFIAHNDAKEINNNANLMVKMMNLKRKIEIRFVYRENQNDFKAGYFVDLLKIKVLQRTISQIDIDGIYSNEATSEYYREANEKFILNT